MIIVREPLFRLGLITDMVSWGTHLVDHNKGRWPAAFPYVYDV